MPCHCLLPTHSRKAPSSPALGTRSSRSHRSCSAPLVAAVLLVLARQWLLPSAGLSPKGFAKGVEKRQHEQTSTILPLFSFCQMAFYTVFVAGEQKTVCLRPILHDPLLPRGLCSISTKGLIDHFTEWTETQNDLDSKGP